MKKIILATLLTLLMITSIVAQQLTDGFETWPSPNWNLIETEPETNTISQSSDYANTGVYSLMFSSYDSADSYDQYMVSNEINWTEAANEFSFYHHQYDYGTESIAVGWSTTGNDVDTDFTWTDEINPGTTWVQYLKTDLPANTKYVAIHYFSDYQYFCYIDDVVLGNPLAGTPDAPVLVSPANLATDVAIDVDLTWTTGDNTDHAVLYLADNATFTGGTVVDPAITGYTSSLENSTIYYWKVVAVSASNIETASAVRSFSTPLAEGGYAWTLTDQYNDSWNGAKMDVLVESVVILDDITLPSGPPQSWVFTAEMGETITSDFHTDGSYPGECSFELFDYQGNLLASGDNETAISYMVPLAGTPDIPTLVSPENLATDVAIDVDLEWTTGDFTDHVALYLTSATDFTGVTPIDPATSPYTTSLEYSTTYYWKVVAISEGELEAESLVRSFTTMIDPATPATPVLVSPANNTHNVGLTPNLEWQVDANTSDVDVYFSTVKADVTAMNASALVVDGQNVTSYQAQELDPLTLYYWRVIAHNTPNELVTNGPVWQFVTEYGEGYVGISIGDGTTSSYQYPWNFYYGNSVAETIYLAEELVISGEILGISYYNTFVTDLPEMPVNIWIGETTQTDLATPIQSSALTVAFEGTVDFPAGQNLINITFDRPYEYAGGNLVILTERPLIEEWYSSSDKFFNTLTGLPNRTLSWQDDSVDLDPDALTAGTASASMPNTSFYFTDAGMGSVAGTVSNGRTGLEGVQLAITGTYHQTMSAADGSYEFPHVAVNDAYTLTASLAGYTDASTRLSVTEGAETEVNLTMSELPTAEITGQIVANDTGLGMQAHVSLTGYADYEVDTDANGYFTIGGVFINQTYTGTATAEGYQTATFQAVVADVDLELGAIVVTERLFYASYVLATLDGDDAVITWEAINPESGESVHEGFEEAFPPANWDTVVNNTTESWAQYETVSFTDSDVVPTEGMYQAGVKFDYAAQDEWLITNAMDCPVGNLTFDFYGHNGSINGDNYYVKVSTDGGTNWTPIWNASDLPDADNHYDAPVVIPLTAYVGQNVQFAWNFVDGDGLGLWYTTFIDNINIGETNIRTSELTAVSKAPKTSNITRLTRNKKNPNEPAYIPMATNVSNTSRSFESYNVYRFLKADEANPENWILVGEEVDGLTYRDEAWSTLAVDYYEYAVKAVYTNGNEANASLSNWLQKTSFVDLTFNVGANAGGVIANANITLVAQTPNPDGQYPEYTGVTDALGSAVINTNLGMYDYTVIADNYEVYTNEIQVSADATIAVTLYEMVDVTINVVSNAGAIVANANIALIAQAPNAIGGYEQYSGITDASGSAVINANVGMYDITVTASGYDRYTGEMEAIAGATIEVTLDEIAYPATNVLATIVEDAAVVTWDESVLTDDVGWITKAAEESYTGVGINAEAVIDASQMYTQAELADYQGMYINSIKIFPTEATATYTLKVWGGVDGNIELYSQAVTEFTNGVWNEYALASSVAIPTSGPVYIGYTADTPLGYPIGADEGPAVTGGSMIKLNNQAYWDNLADLGLSYNWNIQAYVSWFSGVRVATGQRRVLQIPKNIATANLRIEKRNLPAVIASDNSRALESYNVYRLLDEDQANTENWTLVEEETDLLTYTDNDWSMLSAGLYKYAVRAVYTNYMSYPVFSNIVYKDMQGNVEGYVTSEAGNPIANAEVYLGNDMTTTDANGYFLFSDIFIGGYDITAYATGFTSALRTVTVVANETQSVSIVLGFVFDCPNPANINIAITGNSANLTWDDVTVNNNQEAVSNVLYVVYSGDNPHNADEYYFLAETTLTNYEDTNIGVDNPKQFYIVKAYGGDSGEILSILNGLQSQKRRMNIKDVENLIKRGSTRVK